MPTLKIQNFDGESPRTGDTFLEPNGATIALNVRLYSGELRTWDGSVEVTDIVLDTALGAETFYKYYNTDLALTEWLSWTSDVDVQKSSLGTDTDYRLYYTGDGTPKKTNWTLATDDTAGGMYPGLYYEMGVPAPVAAPTLAGTTAGTNPVEETRFYVYTYISTFGSITEESAPSPAAEITLAASKSVDISGFSAVPAGDYNITDIRIYRTLTGENSTGTYVFVKEISIATSTTNDDLGPADLGEALATTDWDAPPATLQGLTSMANGMMAGFVGNTVYFCEPYYHHAWPLTYAQSIPDQIVGLASYGTTLVVMTQGTPYAMIGTSPSTISVERIAIPEPCVSKKSIVNDAYGVMYASPNGIVGIGPTTRGLVSNRLFRRKEWNEYNPATMVGAVYDGKYFLSFQSSIHGNNTMVVSRDDIPSLSFLEVRAASWYFDEQEGDLFYLDPDTNAVYQLDADELNPFVYEWTSKRFKLDRALTWSVASVDIDTAQQQANALYAALLAEIQAENQAITGETFGEINGSMVNEYLVNGSILQELPLEGALVSCTIFIYNGLDELQTSISVTDLAPFRLPPFRLQDMKIKLSGTLFVRSVTLATSFDELRNG